MMLMTVIPTNILTKLKLMNGATAFFPVHHIISNKYPLPVPTEYARTMRVKIVAMKSGRTRFFFMLAFL